ncbi:MAG: hypothetical protein AAFN43_02650 [Pseudomonadota bacterium]
MADYLSILKKTIDGLPNNTPEVRQAVYRKARAAIEVQLRGINPPLSESLIATQLRSLEEAILVVDSEYAAPAAQPPIAPEPVPEQVAPASPAVPEAIPEAKPEPAPDVPQVPETAAVTETPSADVPPPAAQEAGSIEVSGSMAPPPTAGMIDDDFSAGQAYPETGKPSGVEPMVDAPSRQSSTYVEDEPRSGGFGKVVFPLVLLLALGAGGYGLWANKDSLQPMLTSLLSGSESQTTEETAQPVSQDEQILNEDTAAQAEKDDVKLGDGNKDEAPAAEEEVVSVEPTETPIQLEDEASAEDTPSETDQPVREVTEDTETASDTSNQALPIGEVAYLYEEGSAGAGATRTNAAIAWSLKRESISDGLPPEQVIVGTMEVPEKDLSMQMELKRNVDASISASHIIELRFTVPEGFTGSGIDNISRFVMKATEEARGEPLVAVPVKVSEGFFLIALDNLKQAVDVNTQLLLDSAWIDIPISYSTGKRALVTLEKGGTGDQVFRAAFQDWRNRQ